MKTNFRVITDLISRIFELPLDNLDYELMANKNSLNLKISVLDEAMVKDSNYDLNRFKEYLSNTLKGYILNYHNITIIGKTLILEVKL